MSVAEKWGKSKNKSKRFSQKKPQMHEEVLPGKKRSIISTLLCIGVWQETN